MDQLWPSSLFLSSPQPWNMFIGTIITMKVRFEFAHTLLRLRCVVRIIYSAITRLGA